jgi:hypothetical protein
MVVAIWEGKIRLWVIFSEWSAWLVSQYAERDLSYYRHRLRLQSPNLKQMHQPIFKH